MFKFEITHKAPDSYARTGLYTTPHGAIETPNFIFCGTKASVKGLSPRQMREAGTDIILSNTYHLMLSPGAEHARMIRSMTRIGNWAG